MAPAKENRKLDLVVGEAERAALLPADGLFNAAAWHSEAEAPVDGESDAGDEGGVVGDEIESGGSDFLGGTVASHRLARNEVLPHLFGIGER